MIRKTLAAALVSGIALVAATTGSAEAFSRTTVVHGASTGYIKTVNHYCFEGSCYAESALVGEYGWSFLRSRQCTQTAPGEYACEGSLTGSGGRSANWSGTATVSR